MHSIFTIANIHNDNISKDKEVLAALDAEAQIILEQEKKIESLERNIGQMKKNIENIQSHKYKHLDQLSITLRTLDVSSYFINKITEKYKYNSL